MFNDKLREKAVSDLEIANRQYVIVFKKTVKEMEELYRARQRAIISIKNTERYIISLANKPREFDTKMGDIRIRYIQFDNQIDKIKKMEEDNIDESNNAGFWVGIGGTAVASTAVTMTLGSTSAGTALASLSGIATTNAALAWLGGETMVLGGAGIAGGQALLSFIGPIGWALGGTALLGKSFLIVKNNSDIARKAENSTRIIITEKNRIEKISAQVMAWSKETRKLTVELTKKITKIRRKKNYFEFSEDEKREVAIIINMAEVLSKKLGDEIK